MVERFSLRITFLRGGSCLVGSGSCDGSCSSFVGVISSLSLMEELLDSSLILRRFGMMLMAFCRKCREVGDDWWPLVAEEIRG